MKHTVLFVVLVVIGMLIGAMLGALRGSFDEHETTNFPGTTEPSIDGSPESVSTLSDGSEDTPALVPVLTMSGQNLLQVPMTLFEHTELVSVDLSHNKLTGTLPAEVRHLQNLERLDLSHNQFTGVPAEIGQLSKLRILDLSYNKITGLPHELGTLHQLEVLDLTGNEYSAADLAVIRESLPETTEVRINTE